MSIALRVRKIRELTGWKQTALASELHITQQAYQHFELSADKANIESLRRFCSALNIELAFLISEDIPITEENISKYGKRSFFETIKDFEKNKTLLEAFKEMFVIQRPGETG